jgi:hypothetical protein
MEPRTGPNHERRLDLDRCDDEWPVAADVDGVALAGAKHRLGQRLEGVFLSRGQQHEGAFSAFAVGSPA